MTVRIEFRENRLSKLVAKFGGLTVAKALKGAEANLEAIREACVAEVDRLIGALQSAAADAEASGEPEARRRVYVEANAIAGLAGSCGLADLGEAAFNLCELTDRSIMGGVWNAEAVRVHVHAIGLLRSVGGPEEAELRRSILDGLAGIVEKAPRPEQA